MQIRNLQSHIFALFLVLMVVVPVGGFALINIVGMTAARKSIGEDLGAARSSSNGCSSRTHTAWCRVRA
jgi:hypothetical protein